MKIFKKITNCLNNENAGPNLETIIGLGVSISIICALLIVAKYIYSWVYKASKLPTHYNYENKT